MRRNGRGGDGGICVGGREPNGDGRGEAGGTERGTWEKIREWMVFVWVRGLLGLCGWVLLGASES